jgi:hypothetical protein
MYGNRHSHCAPNFFVPGGLRYFNFAILKKKLISFCLLQNFAHSSDVGTHM